MKTYPIPEGATHVLVADGPVSWIVPGTSGGSVLSTFANGKQPEPLKHDKETIFKIRSEFERTKKNLPHSLRFRADIVRRFASGGWLNKEELAERAGYATAGSVANILLGHVGPNKALVLEIAERMKVPFHSLLELNEEEIPNGKVD